MPPVDFWFHPHVFLAVSSILLALIALTVSIYALFVEMENGAIYSTEGELVSEQLEKKEGG